MTRHSTLLEQISLVECRRVTDQVWEPPSDALSLAYLSCSGNNGNHEESGQAAQNRIAQHSQSDLGRTEVYQVAIPPHRRYQRLLKGVQILEHCICLCLHCR